MSLAALYFRSAVLLGLAGILLGIFMGVHQDFRLAHFHAHLNLLGFVAFFLAGAFYAVVPQAAHGLLPRVQYAVSLLGLLIFLAGLCSVALGAPLVILAVIGSLLVLGGFLIFVWIVFRARIA